MTASIEQLLEQLYGEIEEAKPMPLSNDKCVIERDRILDMIDDVKAEMPAEIKRAEDLVANRNDYIASAKAEAYARQLVNKDAIVREAQAQADDILADTEEKCRMIKSAASEYCEDALRRMEEAVADAYDEVKQSRAKFRSALGAPLPRPAAGCTTPRRTRTTIERPTASIFRPRPLGGPRPFATVGWPGFLGINSYKILTKRNSVLGKYAYRMLENQGETTRYRGERAVTGPRRGWTDAKKMLIFTGPAFIMEKKDEP